MQPWAPACCTCGMMQGNNEGLDVDTRRWRWAHCHTATAWLADVMRGVPVVPVVLFMLLALWGAPPAWAARPAAAAAAPPLQGTVTKVTDGDSLWFTPSGQAHIVVRLSDIDAPETCQNWGPEARQALADMVLGKPAVLQTKGRDVHGRVLGALRVDELDVGTRLVQDGHAWSTRSRWDQGPLVKQERMARALRRGLHATGDAEMPRNFRVTHGPCAAGEAPAPAPAPAASRGPAASRAAAALPAFSGTPTGFRCDGRTHCSQMHSCDEAKYFLAHCPAVKMDGDRDGVPCEAQWCH